MKMHESLYPAVATAAESEALRREFLIPGLFTSGEAHFHYWETDRTVVGGIAPLGADIALPCPAELRSAHFLERREAGVINLGGPGAVQVDGVDHAMARLDALYLGRGARNVVFRSASAKDPALFYLLSYPAHAAYPVRHVAIADVKGDALGSVETCNQRTLYKLIHPGAFPTCQLVMGVTRLATGSVWNTMPPHTHLRRSEVYLYFDVPSDQAVFHFMGRPQATRHLVLHNHDVVLSPPWSIHSGVGTRNYSFVWGMGGENQEFADMDPAPIAELR
ncbi:4-deoxy-L-threo-5-hexosulose-uronate ketol-isomerase [mine drainage metagenome]|uniref:5-dehydro-4-deoxy-D-glucuronate isomerase n=1 Tax=mine drainage metagenome TaxID=410659 RepID=A0A1J5T4A7_9ZZZZ